MDIFGNDTMTIVDVNIEGEKPLMNTNERELILKDEVYQIVGAAMVVSNQLGCGFLEDVYQEALEIELAERRSAHVPQKRIAISYKGRAMTIVDMNIEGENR